VLTVDEVDKIMTGLEYEYHVHLILRHLTFIYRTVSRGECTIFNPHVEEELKESIFMSTSSCLNGTECVHAHACLYMIGINWYCIVIGGLLLASSWKVMEAFRYTAVLLIMSIMPNHT
jgi:hypothetical protein